MVSGTWGGQQIVVEDHDCCPDMRLNRMLVVLILSDFGLVVYGDWASCKCQTELDQDPILMR